MKAPTPCPVCGETRTKGETGKAMPDQWPADMLDCWNFFTGGCHTLVAKMDPDHAEELGSRFLRGGGDW